MTSSLTVWSTTPHVQSSVSLARHDIETHQHAAETGTVRHVLDPT